MDRATRRGLQSGSEGVQKTIDDIGTEMAMGMVIGMGTNSEWHFDLEGDGHFANGTENRLQYNISIELI